MKQGWQGLDPPVTGDFHTAVFTTAAKVVSLQVHDHRQLRRFLSAVDQLLFQLAILPLIASSRPCPLYGPGLNRSSFLSEEQFRRRTDDDVISALQIRPVERRTDFPQSREQREWRPL